MLRVETGEGLEDFVLVLQLSANSKQLKKKKKKGQTQTTGCKDEGNGPCPQNLGKHPECPEEGHIPYSTLHPMQS